MKNRMLLVVAVGLWAVLPNFGAMADKDLSADAVLDEVKEQLEGVREWVSDKVEDVKAEVHPAEPLGQTVTLTFAIEGERDTFTVSTALSHYRLEGSYSHSATEVKAKDKQHAPVVTTTAKECVVEASGTVREDKEAGSFLVSCEGSFVLTETTTAGSPVETSRDVLVEFDASALLKPGKKHVLTSQGNAALTVTLSLANE